MNALLLKKKASGKKGTLNVTGGNVTCSILFRKLLHNLFPDFFKNSIYFDPIIPFLVVFP